MATIILLSIISAFFGALFTVLNHKLIQSGHKSIIITTWEMLGGGLLITLYLLFNNQLNSSIIPTGLDMIYMLILGIICTAFAFSITFKSSGSVLSSAYMS